MVAILLLNALFIGTATYQQDGPLCEARVLRCTRPATTYYSASLQYSICSGAQALGAALQYAVLAMFVWTLAQAVYLYLSLVVVLFSLSSTALWIAMGLSWGAPRSDRFSSPTEYLLEFPNSETVTVRLICSLAACRRASVVSSFCSAPAHPCGHNARNLSAQLRALCRTAVCMLDTRFYCKSLVGA